MKQASTDLSKSASSGGRRKSKRPEDVQHDPSLNGYLWLVAAEVADFLDRRGIGSDWANELFAEGSLKLASLLERDAEGLPDFRCKKFRKGEDGKRLSVAYVRLAISRSIVNHWQRSKAVHIKPSTRRDIIARGEEPDDPNVYQWDAVFDSNGLRGGFDEHESCLSESAGSDIESFRSTDKSSGEWSEGERTWFAQQTNAEAWAEVIETLEVLFTVCRDGLDRAIVHARIGDMDAMIANDGWTDPVHVGDVAALLGITESDVVERLDTLECRFYKHAAICSRVPEKRKKQKPRRNLFGAA